MSALLEFECQVPVDGYEVVTVEDPEPEPDPEDGDAPSVVVFGRWRFLQPRSERTRRFELFDASPSAFLEFAQTPDTPDAIKGLADRYGPLEPDKSGGEYFEYRGRRVQSVRYGGRGIGTWSMRIREMRQTVELWKKSMVAGDFRKITRFVQKNFVHAADFVPGVPVELLLKEDLSSATARLCIRPRSLIHALWAEFLLAIDGNANLGACTQCGKWFTLVAGRGRSDKEYCSNACRMRAYRKRKGTGVNL
jgi:hypothetical protein